MRITSNVLDPAHECLVFVREPVSVCWGFSVIIEIPMSQSHIGG